MNKSRLLILISVIVFGAVVILSRINVVPLFFTPRNSNSENMDVNIDYEQESIEDVEPYKVIVTELKIPWEIVFLDNKPALITERPGDVLKITLDGDKTKIQKIDRVKQIGEGGLPGMTLDPEFSENHMVFLYMTTSVGGLHNEVVSYKYESEKLLEPKVIVDDINASSNHDGGRIKFGPDGYLYITTGDAETPNSAQDNNSLNGKILRIKKDGTIPDDNPFGNEVYSYGHRNVQGIDWDQDGNLWATEHGPSGTQTGNDEINLIEKGANYGWPIIRGTQVSDGMKMPTIESGRSDTWAPSGLISYKNSLLYAGLRGETLYRAHIENKKITKLEKYFTKEFGRLRTVILGPDGYLYILTNNTDGRGKPKSGDDKLIRINPILFE